jgi:hypothetical protein
MIFAGPDIGGAAPMPPGIPTTASSNVGIPAEQPPAPPVARVELPDHMRTGLPRNYRIEGVQPGLFDDQGMFDILNRTGLQGNVSIQSTMDSMDDGRFEIARTINDLELSSFA